MVILMLGILVSSCDSFKRQCVDNILYLCKNDEDCRIMYEDFTGMNKHVKCTVNKNSEAKE